MSQSKSVNIAARIHGPGDLRLEELPVPEIGDHDALVLIDCVGICGSDVKLHDTGRCGLEVLTNPTVGGHEGAGVVLRVGAGVTRVKPGDRVAIEPTQPCGSCNWCRHGRYNLCRRPHYCSVPPAPGVISVYYKHRADFLHILPDHVTMEEGAALQPLSIAVHACRRGGISVGDRVLILGAGPIGVLILMVAKAIGAGYTVMTDVSEKRLKVAKEFGAEETVLVRPDEAPEEIVNRVRELFCCDPDVSVDACGAESTTNVALQVTRCGGVALIVGIGAPKQSLALMQAMMREVDIRGSYRLVNTYEAALSLVASGRVQLKRYITHHFSLKEVHEAFKVAKGGDDAMKVVIHLQPRDANNPIPFTTK